MTTDIQSSKATQTPVVRPETAEKLMITKVPKAKPTYKIDEIRKMLSESAGAIDSFGYIYIVDGAEKLIGVISLKEIFTSNGGLMAKDVMKKDVISARRNTDQEHVAALALKHNIKSVPVVDKDNKFLGVVPPHQIFKVLHEEGVEDMLLSAGIFNRGFGEGYDLSNMSASKNIIKRIPWLIVGLAGGVLAAIVVRSYESALEQEILVAAFIPAVVYIADSVGAQTQTIFVRALAMDRQLSVLKYSIKEMIIALFIGMILSALIAAVSIIIWGNQLFAITLLISIFFTILASAIIALILPVLSLKFKFDPAIASGPFATTVRDILSLLIYFTTAYFILGII